MSSAPDFPTSFTAQTDLPESVSAAALRGIKGTCPRCGKASLFRKWLKPVERCGTCDHDWSVQQADDFPAYIAIFIVGHLLIPFVTIMIVTLGLSAGLTFVILVPVAIVMLMGMLQPTKGAVIAFLWWRGIGAFRKERRAVVTDAKTPDEI